MIIEETLDIQKIAVFVMHSKGYDLILDRSEDSNDILYIARKKENSFYADSWISLLALIEIGEIRNDNWRLNAEEANYTQSIEDKLYDYSNS